MRGKSPLLANASSPTQTPQGQPCLTGVGNNPLTIPKPSQRAVSRMPKARRSRLSLTRCAGWATPQHTYPTQRRTPLQVAPAHLLQKTNQERKPKRLRPRPKSQLHRQYPRRQLPSLLCHPHREVRRRRVEPCVVRTRRLAEHLLRKAAHVPFAQAEVPPYLAQSGRVLRLT